MTVQTGTRTAPMAAWDRLRNRLDDIAGLRDGDGQPSVCAGCCSRVAKLLARMQLLGVHPPEDLVATDDGAVILCWYDERVTLEVSASHPLSVVVEGRIEGDGSAVDIFTAVTKMDLDVAAAGSAKHGWVGWFSLLCCR